MSGITRAARIRRVIAASAVALVVAGGAIAGPASASSLASFSGTGTGYALRITLDVRPLIKLVPALGTVLDTVWSSVPGQTGKFSGVIDQTFIKTTSDATGAGSHKARSVLAEGLLNLDSLEASTVGQNLSKVVKSLQLPAAGLPLIDGAIGTLKAAVGNGPGVNGSGTLESLKVGLPLGSLPTNVVTDLVSQLTGVVDGLTTQLTSVLNGVLGGSNSTSLVNGLTSQIGNLAGSLPVGSSVLGGLTSGLGLGSVSQLSNATAVSGALGGLLDPTALLNQITGLLRTNLLSGALADMSGLINITRAVRSGDGTAISDSAATLKNLDVLGGLVNVGLFNLKSHSEAAGTTGSAMNTSSCSLGDVKIGGGALKLSLDGKNIFLNGQPVPVVGDLVGTVKGLVDQVLNVLGIQVGLCDVAQKEAAADGSAAAQRVSALRIKIAPLNLFSLVIDPTVETQAAAQVAAPTSNTSNPSLPRTGAAPLATIIMGLGLAGAAIFARKRFFA